jgi:hypothetical protein
MLSLRKVSRSSVSWSRLAPLSTQLTVDAVWRRGTRQTDAEHDVRWFTEGDSYR